MSCIGMGRTVGIDARQHLTSDLISISPEASNPAMFGLGGAHTDYDHLSGRSTGAQTNSLIC